MKPTNAPPEPVGNASPDLELRGDAPLYRRLVERISEDISKGSLSPGERLPTEAELGRRYGLSRITVRQALVMLASQGLVTRLPSRGAFVADRPSATAWEMSSIADLVQLGSDVQTDIISWGLTKPTPEIALFLKTAEPVYRLRAVRTHGAAPMFYTESYLQPELGALLPREELKKRTIVDLLTNHLAVRVEQATEEIEAGIADETLARRLRIEPGAPVLIQRIDLFDAKGEPVQRGIGWWRSDRFRRKYVMRRTGAESPRG